MIINCCTHENTRTIYSIRSLLFKNVRYFVLFGSCVVNATTVSKIFEIYKILTSNIEGRKNTEERKNLSHKINYLKINK